jgi:ParB family chromosome partitioning protein
MIATELLKPHVDNPRKDLGDLTELAESIKAKGIFQNLTVVPVSDGTYTVIIGHRRLAAAKLAGVKELPCAVRSMTEREQLSTMLLENMQRSDLTILEQADGIQMMLDLGDSVKSVSEQTGLSESTVRRRTNLLKLNRDKMKEAQMRGGTLEDYEKVLKIKDEELRNRVLDVIGTNSFEWTLKSALKDEAAKERKQEIIEKAREFATETTYDEDGLRFYRSFYDWADEEIKIPEDVGEREYFYIVTDNGVSIYYRPTAEEIKERDEREAEYIEALKLRDERNGNLRQKFKLMEERRNDFIKSFTPDKEKTLCIIKALLSKITFVSTFRSPMMEKILNMTGMETAAVPNGVTPTVENICTDEKDYYKALLAAVCGALLREYAGFCYDCNGRYREDEGLNQVYKLLEEIGFEVSDEEAALLNGTHDLYLKE